MGLMCVLYSIMLHRLWKTGPVGRASAESIRNKKRVIKVIMNRYILGQLKKEIYKNVYIMYNNIMKSFIILSKNLSCSISVSMKETEKHCQVIE